MPDAVTILLVTAVDEHGSDLIVSESTRRGVPLLRLNLDDEPVQLEARLDDDGRWSGRIGQYGRSVPLREIGALWCRSIRRPPGDPVIHDPAEKAWAAGQDRAALAGILRALPGPWINHPDQVQAASHKATQLHVATRLGFHVPRTLITASGEVAAAWAGAQGRPVLCKPFDPGGTRPHGWVPASPITAPIPEIPLGAQSIFQEVIDGVAVRVTVVGERLFATQIVPAADAPQIDWRMGQADADMYPAEVPTPIRRRILAFQQWFGLTYGAYDFINADDLWWFLECNPVGQYGFVELRTGQPITAAIVDRLCPASASTDNAPPVVTS